MIPAIGHINPAVKLSAAKEWSLSNIAYVRSKGLNVTYSAYPFGLVFDPTGTYLFVVSSYRDRIARYSLSTPWDVSTATHNSLHNLNIASYTGYAQDIAFNASGQYVFWCNYTNDSIYRRFNTDPYELDSGGTPTLQLTDSTNANTPYSFCFGNNGYKLYILTNTGYLAEYDLSSPFRCDLSTFVQSTLLTVGSSTFYSVRISPSGYKLAIFRGTVAYIYTLSTQWDSSTVNSTPESFNMSTYATIKGLWISPDGNKLYVTDYKSTAPAVLEFNL